MWPSGTPAIASRRHDRVEIGVGEAGGESVDANDEARARFGFHRVLHEIRRARARAGLARGGNRILEVDDHRVGAARHRLVELAPAVGRDEQQRAHQLGRMRMNTCRRHSATSLLS
jgi:hypothetical protein